MGTAGGEHGDGKPQIIKGLVIMGPRGAAGASMGQSWAVGPTGPLVGCIVGLKGSRRRLWGENQGCGLPAAGRVAE